MLAARYPVLLSQSVIRELAYRFQGELMTSDDPAYDAARAVCNGIIDKYPAVIARATSVDDVVAAVKFARRHNLPIAVRDGGHNLGTYATCDDGIVIDLAPMKRIDVNPSHRVARAQGGVTWGELDAATQVYGLAAPGGLVSHTGIAGMTLGGGFGWLRGKYGLSCDNLIAAEVVTADGRVIRASERENPDLLWGLRGGGGNFGIVTALEFRLHPVGPQVMFAFVVHDAGGDRGRQALQFYREYSATAPDQVSSILSFGTGSAEVGFPLQLDGRPCVLFAAMYAGMVEAGRRALQPLLDFGTPLFDQSGEMPYLQAQQAWDALYARGSRHHWQSLNLLTLDDTVIERLSHHAQRQPSAASTVDVWHVGGAVSRVKPDVSAFPGRHAAFMVNVQANWSAPADDQANFDAVAAFIAALRPYSDGTSCLSFPALHREDDAQVRRAFGGQYERLVSLKRRYDPTNLFSLNPNILPAG